MNERLPFAVVHGRFQPFHNEHLAYCQWALQRGDTLVVGITNFDRSEVSQEATSSHRHTDAANPFAYWERALMVRDSLLEAGVAPGRFSIVALPIHRVDRWAEYVPTATAASVHLLRVFSPWEEEKARRLRQAGLRVEAIHGGEKLLCASDVRQRIALGGQPAGTGEEPWERDVPAACARWIKAVDGVRRIRALHAER
jgi:nicotinamide-nucleotide adenylyltransferase